MNKSQSYECYKSLHGIKVHTVLVSRIDSTGDVVRELILLPPSSNNSITPFPNNKFMDNLLTGN